MENNCDNCDLRPQRWGRESGEDEEDGLAVAGKSKEATDLKKYLKMLQNLTRAASKLLK